ncbi:hypothetical protein D3C71_1769100 [compost metagenome]
MITVGERPCFPSALPDSSSKAARIWGTQSDFLNVVTRFASDGEKAIIVFILSKTILACFSSRAKTKPCPATGPSMAKNKSDRAERNSLLPFFRGTQSRNS